MRYFKTLALILTGIALAFGAPDGQEEHHHPGGPTEKLGKVHFPVSCNTAAQKQFERAVAILHSFGYEEAIKGFTAVTQADSSCAMGYWGVAMSYWHPLWYPPEPSDLKSGSGAVEKARAANAKTERERDYIEAIGAFYKDSDKLDHPARALAYEQAMEQVYLRHPQDREAAAFYGLALLATASPSDKTYANQKKAGAILEKIFAEQPEHPGAAHYIIHSFDSPALAPLALKAARNYAKIAPSAPHALHMPSHIFTRLGYWDESIQSNLASESAAKDYAVKTHMQAAWMNQLHAMDYLEYAYLQCGQDREAKRVADELKAIRRAHPEDASAAYAFSAIPARYIIERRQWSEASSLKLRPDDFPWNRFPWAEANLRFARALGAARAGDKTGAQKEIEKLASLRDGLIAAKNSYWSDQVEIQLRAASSWLAHAEGKNDEAARLMRAAADLEDSTEKHPVTPGPIVPARELLGDLFLELNEPEQALSAFATSLHASPNRLNGLYGAARAAELAGDEKMANAFHTKLLEVTKHADGHRPELRETELTLGKKRTGDDDD